MFYFCFFFLPSKVLQASLCVVLGAVFNMNKEEDQNGADKTNDVVLVITILIVATNIVINAFEMKEVDDSAS